MMSLVFLYSPGFGYLCLLLWDIQPIAAMETSGGANISWPSPTVVTVPRGVIVILPCRLPWEWITHNYRLQWYRSPVPVGARNEPYGRVEGATIYSSSPTASLRIKPEALEDVGVYFCVVTSVQKQFWGNGTELRVLDMEASSGARVSQYPPVVTVSRGGSVVLPCRLPRESIAQNDGVQWYRGTLDSWEEPTDISFPALPPRFSLTEDKASLRIVPVVAEDAGEYHCVKNVSQSQIWGRGSDLLVLAMETSGGANVSRPLPTVVTVTRGVSIFLPCRLPREWITQNNMVQWYYRTPGPAGAQNETYRQVERFFHRKGMNSLRIAPVVLEDEGVYFCVVTSGQKQFLGNGTELRVLARERNGGVNMMKQGPMPPVVTAIWGGSVVLPCRVPRESITQNDGVQWYRTPGYAGARNEPYGSVSGAAAIDLFSSHFTLQSDEQSSLIARASLQITKVDVEDVGVYFCVTTFRHKQFWGNGTELRVLAMETSAGADMMKHGPMPPVVTAIRGGSVVLPCLVPRESITQNDRVQWYRTPDPREQPTDISSPALPPRFSLAEDKASLLITPVVAEDADMYYCVINVRQSQIIGDVRYLRVLGMETTGRANVSRPPPTVVTVPRGVNVVLPCHLPREWITQYDRVQWYRSPVPTGAWNEIYGWLGGLAPISSPTLSPRFSHAPGVLLRIEPVAVEDEGVYFCIMTERVSEFWKLREFLERSVFLGNGTELRVLAPPSAPQLFLQAPPDLWSGPGNLFCVTRGFHPNQVRLSWTQNGAESELQDCTTESADPGPVQSNGSVWQKLILQDGCPPNGWLPVSLAMEAKPHPHQRCIYMTDSSGRGPYLVSVLPLSLGPAVGVNYTCAVRDHPALPTALSASFKWEPPSCMVLSEAVRRLNIIKICFISVVTLAFAVAALNSQFKKRATSPLTQKATFPETNRPLRRPLRSRRNSLNTQND